MGQDWDDPRLTDAMLELAKTNGDVYHQLLINPIIEGVLGNAALDSHETDVVPLPRHSRLGIAEADPQQQDAASCE